MFLLGLISGSHMGTVVLSHFSPLERALSEGGNALQVFSSLMDLNTAARAYFYLQSDFPVCMFRMRLV